MAKLTILGDALQLKSDLTREELDRVKRFAPDALKLRDEDKNEYFGIDFGNASMSKYGICFCNEDAEGKIFMTMNNPIIDHENPDAEREFLVQKFASVLKNLETVEAQIASAKENLEAMEAAVDAAVTFAN